MVPIRAILQSRLQGAIEASQADKRWFNACQRRSCLCLDLVRCQRTIVNSEFIQVKWQVTQVVAESITTDVQRFSIWLHEAFRVVRIVENPVDIHARHALAVYPHESNVKPPAPTQACISLKRLNIVWTLASCCQKLDPQPLGQAVVQNGRGGGISPPVLSRKSDLAVKALSHKGTDPQPLRCVLRLFVFNEVHPKSEGKVVESQ
mmetsp:Transcript_110241/g.219028  ORF Transcript_110241/g.219028 Transcript_110241/m.219028 type:complete len:205 (-) Transcript_110241:489-1103(-)